MLRLAIAGKGGTLSATWSRASENMLRRDTGVGGGFGGEGGFQDLEEEEDEETLYNRQGVPLRMTWDLVSEPC